MQHGFSALRAPQQQHRNNNKSNYKNNNISSTRSHKCGSFSLVRKNCANQVQHEMLILISILHSHSALPIPIAVVHSQFPHFPRSHSAGCINLCQLPCRIRSPPAVPVETARLSVCVVFEMASLSLFRNV